MRGEELLILQEGFMWGKYGFVTYRAKRFPEGVSTLQ